MKCEIILLNCMRYFSKSNDTEPMTRLQFIFADYKNSDNHIGAEPITCYYEGHEVFRAITKDMILKKHKAIIKEIKNEYDPLSTILIAINDINLL